MGHRLILFSRHQIRNLDIKYEVRILMVPMAIEVLEVVESMMVITPRTNDDTRITATIEVLEAVKSWSNLTGDDPLEMMSSLDLRNFS